MKKQFYYAFVVFLTVLVMGFGSSALAEKNGDDEQYSDPVKVINIYEDGSVGINESVVLEAGRKSCSGTCPGGGVGWTCSPCTRKCKKSVCGSSDDFEGISPAETVGGD